MRKLIQSNQNESVVKPKVFNEVIGEVWHRVCYAITCQKNIVRMKSLNSEVGQAFKPGLFYYLKFHFRNIQTRINQLFKES